VASLGVGAEINDMFYAFADYGDHRNDFGGGDVYDGAVVTLGLEMRFGPRNERLFTYSPFH